MGSFQSFAEILEKKIRKEIEKDFHSSSQTFSSENVENSSAVQSELWTHLVGQMNPYHFTADQKAAVYHRNRPAPRPRPDHKLTASQAIAFSFFQAHKMELPANFSSNDLKRVFRILALRMHPDQGGSISDFRTLLAARAELQQLFK
jgi:hypothetical protein